MSKASKKLKKPLDLPLGKATSQKDVDLSHVRLPIDTSVLGLKHVLTLFETATNEVKSYLAYECDLMYECRICRTIFRSIANFILHKRKYCRDRYNNPRNPDQACQEPDGVTIIQRDIEMANKIIADTDDDPDTKKTCNRLNPIIENLLKRQEQKKLVDDLKNVNWANLDKPKEPKKVEDLKGISLEKIEGSEVAVFQTMEFGPNLGEAELMKSEVMEIHSIFDQNEAVLGSNGKILSFNIKEKEDKLSLKQDLVCTECNMKFSTKKNLTCHIKYKHSQSRLVYPCPLCKDNLSNVWSVYRHLLKIHRMTSNQIRKYRTQINNGAILKKLEENKERRKTRKDSKDGNDEENEWLDNVEGDSDLQMCGGCGKHFERKAALSSHAVMCTKRIAVCNSIKENNSKKKESDSKENGEKFKPTGSAKRKSSKLITYKPKTENSDSTNDPKVDEEVKRSDKTENEEIPTFIVEENESEEEENSLMERDVQTYDKDELMSIIGVDMSDRSSPASDVNSSSKLSDRSDSPCRGFEAQSMDTKENIMKDLANFGESNDAQTDSNIPECSEPKNTEVGSNIPENFEPKLKEAENEMDVSSDISLDNKIGSDFKLDLCEDPNFLDVSIKPLIREIIDEDIEGSKTGKKRGNEECPVLEVEVEMEETKKNCANIDCSTNEEKTNNNKPVVVGTTKTKKRKRSNTSNPLKKASISKPTEEISSEGDNEAFVLKISPFVDKVNLTCSLCNSRFVSSSELMAHMSHHLSWYRFQCSKCSYMAFDKKDCERHVEKDHNLPCSQGVVLPIPTWKSSLISDNSVLVLNEGNAGSMGSAKMEEGDKLSDLDVDLDVTLVNVPTTEIELTDPLDLEVATTETVDNVVGFIDLTVEENSSDVNCEDSDVFLTEEADPIQDLSKQAILEVILGNDHKKDKNGAEGQTSEYARPSRNRTKSIKASQKDFIYDFDTPKSAVLKGFCSKSDMEQLTQFEVQE